MELGEVLGLLINGNALAVAGAAIGMGLAGIGTAKGLGMSGSTASALTAEQEKNFSTILILEALPQTQAIYAFVIGVMIVSQLGPAMTVEMGLIRLFAGLCVGLTGLTAIYQGAAASAAVAAYGRNNNITSKVMIYVVMCELGALFGFIIAILTLISN
jgi:V/A-type H+/Na+-transporting ATPase subunit K